MILMTEGGIQPTFQCSFLYSSQWLQGGMLYFRVMQSKVQQRQGAAIRFEFDMEPVVTSSAEGSTVRLGPLLLALDLEEQLGLDW